MDGYHDERQSSERDEQLFRADLADGELLAVHVSADHRFLADHLRADLLQPRAIHAHHRDRRQRRHLRPTVRDEQSLRNAHRVHQHADHHRARRTERPEHHRAAPASVGHHHAREFRFLNRCGAAGESPLSSHLAVSAARNAVLESKLGNTRSPF